MFKKNYVLILSAIAIILYISILYGYFETKNPNIVSVSDDMLSPAIEQTEAPSAIKAVETYKIILKSNTIFLLENDKIKDSREIIPSLLPSSDIEFLRGGISYDSYENALMDWESLSN